MLGPVDQVRRQPNVPLEAAGKNLAFDGFSHRIAGGGDPNAASGKLAFDVRHGLAVRPDDEADQLRYRMYRAGGRAQAGTFACTGPAVEIGRKLDILGSGDHRPVALLRPCASVTAGASSAAAAGGARSA